MQHAIALFAGKEIECRLCCFMQTLYIPLPDASARTRIFELRMQDMSHNITKEEFVQLGQMADGFSGSDIKSIVGRSRTASSRELVEAQHFR